MMVLIMTPPLLHLRLKSSSKFGANIRTVIEPRWLFSVIPPQHQFFWEINENPSTKRLEYQPERFNLKFILR